MVIKYILSTTVLSLNYELNGLNYNLFFYFTGELARSSEKLDNIKESGGHRRAKSDGGADQSM